MRNFWNPIVRIRDGIILVLISVIIILFFRITEKNEAIEYVTSEKEQLRKEYNALLTEYKTLQTDNDTLNARIVQEQEKIQSILEELKSVKSENAARVRQFKNELNVLRDIMKGYIAQVDSLNKLNQQLIAENIEVKTNFHEAKGQINKLSKVKQELEDKVTIGSVIQAKNINVYLLNENDKPMNKESGIIKAKKVYKIKTMFTLRENPLAKSGERNVYLRIARPDGLVLTSDDDEGMFSFHGEQIAYSAKRIVAYQNTDVDMSIIWKKNQEIPEGTYTVDLFIDGNMIGTSTFQLK